MQLVTAIHGQPAGPGPRRARRTPCRHRLSATERSRRWRFGKCLGGGNPRERCRADAVGGRLVVRVADAVSGIEFALPCEVAWAYRARRARWRCSSTACRRGGTSCGGGEPVRMRMGPAAAPRGLNGRVPRRWPRIGAAAEGRPRRPIEPAAAANVVDGRPGMGLGASNFCRARRAPQGRPNVLEPLDSYGQAARDRRATSSSSASGPSAKKKSTKKGRRPPRRRSSGSSVRSAAALARAHREGGLQGQARPALAFRRSASSPRDASSSSASATPARGRRRGAHFRGKGRAGGERRKGHAPRPRLPARLEARACATSPRASSSAPTASPSI